MTAQDEADAHTRQVPRSCTCGWVWGHWARRGHPPGLLVWAWARVDPRPDCPWHRGPP